MTMTTLTPQAAKTQGQARSIEPLSDTTRREFLRIVAAVPTGETFSANTIREQLDLAGIPERSRAGLFAAACAAGLCKPEIASVPGVGDVPITEPSTGQSAHRASVRRYRRTALPLRVPPTTCGECGDDLAPGQMGWHGDCFAMQDGA